MKLRKGLWDGAQPRGHIIETLKRYGVKVKELGDDWYELVDRDGDPESVLLPDAVVSEVIVKIWKRFGGIHSFPITALVKKRPKK